jgi:hypothetical protein
MILKDRLAFLFMVVCVCAYGQDVHYNYDRAANFSGYKTYQWVDIPGAVHDPLIDRDIKRAVDEQLAQKGLTKAEKDADLYVGYQAVVNLEKRVNLWDAGAGLGGWGGWGNRTAHRPDFDRSSWHSGSRRL